MEFWSALTLLQKIYFCIGVGGTVFLILQIITLLFGIGDAGEVDVDLSGDGSADVTIDTADGFTLFTFRGLVAFFAIGGWVGYALAPVGTAIAIIGSVLAGGVALVLMGLALKAITKIRSDGNISVNKAIGMTADVYLSIPPKNGGFGKINLTLEERFVELSAMQEGNEVILTGSKVKVVGISGDTLIVEKL